MSAKKPRGLPDDVNRRVLAAAEEMIRIVDGHLSRIVGDLHIAGNTGDAAFLSDYATQILLLGQDLLSTCGKPVAR